MSKQNFKEAYPQHDTGVTSFNLLKYYDDPLDCLTAHFMLECSEVLAGAKPANLISLANRTRPCGRNLYQLWQQHSQELCRRLPDMCFMVFCIKPQSILMLCYDRNNLDRHLTHSGIRCLLQKSGYNTDASTAELLEELCRRVNENSRFPHEIGLFIGYPAKDVAAFMGIVKLPFSCQGPWKIYGNPEISLVLAEKYRSCRINMNRFLKCGRLDLNSLDGQQGVFLAV